MILTTSLKLELNSSDEHILRAEMEKYIACVNSLVALHLSGVSIQKFSSKDVVAELPAAVKNQAIRDAKSVLQRYARSSGRWSASVRGSQSRGRRRSTQFETRKFLSYVAPFYS